MIQFKDSVILCVVIAYAQLVTVVESQDPIVSTQYGKVEGFRYTTPNGFETEVFLGVPYAAPPVGDLRFEKSIPPTPWTTTRQAKDFGAPCLTVPKYTPANASEDCLFMNIIKPKNPSTDPKGYPVMLWIHGGGFLAGSSRDYPYNATAERIVEKGIVYASINYRQGAFGFFSTGNAKAPGNYGLWDQVQALKFIQKVIKKFGGNPDNVTPFAQSSGSIALSLLTLSPKTKNLYNRAIEMSGSSNIRLELNTNDLNASLNLADAVGCGCSTNTKNCLKTKAASEIQAGMGTFIKYLFPGDGTAFPGSFSPRADGDLIPDISYEKLVKRAAKKDILMGVNSQEWYVFALNNSFSNPNATFFPITAAQAANFSLQDFVRIVNGVFATPEIFGTRHQEAANKIVAFYLTQTHYNTSRNFYLQIYAQLASDIIYNVRSMREAKLRAAAGQDIFYYVYEYVPDSMYNAFFERSGHSRDLPNLFGATLALSAIPTTATSQQTFANLFINFAKTGTPTSGSLTAPKVTGSTVRSVRINTVSSIDQNLWTDRIQFWDNLAATYGYDWPENRRLF